MWETCFVFGLHGLAPNFPAMHLCGHDACTKCFLMSWMWVNDLHLSRRDTEDGWGSVESLCLPSFLQSRQLPLTMALSWDALDITTCLSLFNRTVEANVVHLLLLGCLIHSCQGLPKVGIANEPEKMPAGKSHAFSLSPPHPQFAIICFDNST